MFRRSKTFEQLDAEGKTPRLSFPYRTEANIWTHDDIKAWESNNRRSGNRQTYRDDRNDRRDRDEYRSDRSDHKRARR